MSSKMYISSFFSQKEIKVFEENIQDFSHIVDFQWEPIGLKVQIAFSMLA